MRFLFILLACIAAGPASQPSELQVRRVAAIRALSIAKAKVLAPLHDSARYKAAKEHLIQCEAVLAKARESGTPEQRLSASHDFVAAKKSVDEIDAEVERDPGVVKARWELAQVDKLIADKEAAAKRAEALVDGANKIVKVDYDRFKDVTTYELPEPIPFELTKGTGLHEFSCMASVDGDRSIRASKVSLLIMSFSREWIYLKHRSSLQLMIIADGRHLAPLSAVYYDSKVGDYKGGHCREAMGFDLSPEDLKTIVNATTVDAQLLYTEFPINEKFRAALLVLAVRSAVLQPKVPPQNP